ncbi:MAG TPA: MerR family transcriptional regulator [Vicinamibacterales bacterium]|jgi:MerR family redox-sensitive transcriptional activator SoxR|nr:MerR family transcriptional regulator [Vicinamibacterales bacterium]
MTIGALAEQAGLRPSAIRYYERLGLLPAPHRRGGRRDYDPDAVAQLAVVQFARSAGFTLADTRQLVRGFSPAMAAGTRWRALTATKVQEIDALIRRATAMKALLERVSANCSCETLIECGRGLARNRERWSTPNQKRPAHKQMSRPKERI